MIRNLLKFTFVLTFFLVVIGVLHWLFLSSRSALIDLDLFLISYLVNFLMAAGIYLAMLYLAIRKNKYLGFIFLWGSALKFAVYFVILQPLYEQDGAVSRAEFFYFFVPYLIALILETTGVVKLLQSQDNQPDKTSV